MVLAANQEQQCHRMPQKMLLLERNFTWAMRAMVLGRLDNSIEARNPSAPGAPGEFMSWHEAQPWYGLQPILLSFRYFNVFISWSIPNVVFLEMGYPKHPPVSDRVFPLKMDLNWASFEAPPPEKKLRQAGGGTSAESGNACGMNGHSLARGKRRPTTCQELGDLPIEMKDSVCNYGKYLEPDAVFIYLNWAVFNARLGLSENARVSKQREGYTKLWHCLQCAKSLDDQACNCNFGYRIFRQIHECNPLMP